MMEKVLIEIWVPAAQQAWDVFVPRASQLGQVLELLSATVGDLSGGSFLPEGNAVLCDENGNLLDINMTVERLGIQNGSRLMLI